MAHRVATVESALTTHRPACAFGIAVAVTLLPACVREGGAHAPGAEASGIVGITVVDASSKEPIESAVVTIGRDSASATRIGIGLFTTNAHGQFVFDSVPYTDAWVLAQFPGYLTVGTPVVVRPRDSVSVSVELTRGPLMEFHDEF